jgi:very-short-patch-repair endonuclease
MTDAERRLWSALRSRRLHQFKFRRQYPIGPYIVDFACIEHRLIVEADGGQHCENADDARRTAWLEAQGWRVLRFWNNDILANVDGVQVAILRALDDDEPRRPRPSPHPPTLRVGPALSRRERGLNDPS